MLFRSADWREAGEVRHTFTHFHLRLRVLWTRVETLAGDTEPIDGVETAMPTVFATAFRMGRTAAGM